MLQQRLEQIIKITEEVIREHTPQAGAQVDLLAIQPQTQEEMSDLVDELPFNTEHPEEGGSIYWLQEPLEIEGHQLEFIKVKQLPEEEEGSDFVDLQVDNFEEIKHKAENDTENFKIYESEYGTSIKIVHDQPLKVFISDTPTVETL